MQKNNAKGVASVKRNRPDTATKRPTDAVSSYTKALMGQLGPS